MTRLLDMIPSKTAPTPFEVAVENERKLAEREQDLLAKTPTGILVQELARRFGWKFA